MDLQGPPWACRGWRHQEPHLEGRVEPEPGRATTKAVPLCPFKRQCPLSGRRQELGRDAEGPPPHKEGVREGGAQELLRGRRDQELLALGSINMDPRPPSRGSHKGLEGQEESRGLSPPLFYSFQLKRECEA